MSAVAFATKFLYGAESPHVPDDYGVAVYLAYVGINGERAPIHGAVERWCGKRGLDLVGWRSGGLPQSVDFWGEGF